MLSAYVKNVRIPFDNGQLKQGGKSFAESLISDLVKSAFPDFSIKRNVRPDWLRSEKGKPIELDIMIPEMKIAIEVQGPQHFRQIYGDREQHQNLKKNDLLKKQKCREQGLRLIWMSVDGINKDIVRVPKREKLRVIEEIISNLQNSTNKFVFWKNAKEYALE